jgi:hypothetical protein
VPVACPPGTFGIDRHGYGGRDGTRPRATEMGHGFTHRHGDVATANTIFGGTSLSTHSIESFEGREIFDSSGYKIGDIESVVREDGPAFALVKSGLFGTMRRLVPLNDVRQWDGDLVVPYTKDKVKSAPPATTDRRPSAERSALTILAAGWSRS